MARAYSGKPYAAADIDWLLDTAASYLLEETDDAGSAVVRLFHKAFGEHVRGRTQPSMVERVIAMVLAERAEAAGGWLRAERYARVHTASHAAGAGGGLLDLLVNDPGFLLAADRRGLLRALPSLGDAEGRRAGICYRAAASRLSGDAAADAAYLELESRRTGNDALADRIRQLGLAQPFTTRLASRPAPALEAFEGHTGQVWALAWGVLGGAPVLASAGADGIVRLWDPRQHLRAAVISFGGPVFTVFTVSISPEGWFGITGLEGLAVLMIRPEAFTNPQTARPWSFSAAPR